MVLCRIIANALTRWEQFSSLNVYNSAMPLTENEKQRIREEEIERLKARREYRGAPRNVAIFWSFFTVVSVLLYTLVRSGHH